MMLRLLIASISMVLLCGQKGKMPESPWELRLSVAGDSGLKAELHNRYSAAQTYLYDSKLQPVELVLEQGGVMLESFDTRAEAKFDNTVYRRMFKDLPANSTVLLTEGKIGADRSLRWGPFLFTNLKPGIYHAHAVWHSETDEYFDPRTKRTGTVRGVWKGTVKSITVEWRVR